MATEEHESLKTMGFSLVGGYGPFNLGLTRMFFATMNKSEPKVVAELPMSCERPEAVRETESINSWASDLSL